ncbi:hypothetical protein HMPREF1556_00623 [Porphyromonas sp. oral taxon 278 str. W7784]|nr:hypothetical protein HMPREF1556_00623 [Porphyromonas sp. oral taxon 278 str. W7784]
MPKFDQVQSIPHQPFIFGGRSASFSSSCSNKRSSQPLEKDWLDLSRYDFASPAG